MKIEDIDKEFKELAQSLRDGQIAFVSGRFKEAEPLYRRALELLEGSYGEEHSDTALCLQNLADCHYNQRKYAEAVPLLRRLLIIKEKHQGVSHPDVATTLFKLAKVYEKSGMPKESESFYRRALKVGEQAYGPNHQFVGTILESFAAMLKRAQMRLPEAAQMEERLREIREISHLPPMGSSIPPGQMTARDMDAIAEQGVSARMSKPDLGASGRYERPDLGASGAQIVSDQSPSGRYNVNDLSASTRMRSLKSATERMEPEPEAEADVKRPALGIFIIVLVLFVVATAGATAFLLNSQKKDGKPLLSFLTQTDKNDAATTKKESAPAKSQDFASADGLKRLLVRSPSDAVMLSRGITLAGKATIDEHTITFIPQTQSIKYIYTVTPFGVCDAEGAELYARTAGETLIIARMQIMAVLLQEYYRQNHTYPKQTDDILSINQHIVYKNPWTKQEVLPVKKILSPAAELDPEFALPNDIAQVQGQLQNLLLPSSTPVNTPGTIEWYRSTNTAEGEVVYIRGTNGEGKLITCGRPHVPYVIQLVAGRRRPDLQP